MGAPPAWDPCLVPLEHLPMPGPKRVRVVEGLDVMDALYDGYGESALGGIRAGKQDPLFQQGNAYLRSRFPRLDYIRTARVQ